MKQYDCGDGNVGVGVADVGNRIRVLGKTINMLRPAHAEVPICAPIGRVASRESTATIRAASAILALTNERESKRQPANFFP